MSIRLLSGQTRKKRALPGILTRDRVTTFARHWRTRETESWAIFVNGRHLTAEDRRFPPSQRLAAYLVGRWLKDHGPA